MRMQTIPQKIVDISNYPFNYVIVDDFLPEQQAMAISESIPEYDSQFWNCSYNSPLEKKKACNDWNRFSPFQYTLFQELMLSNGFVKHVEKLIGESGLVPDYGLHGGGFHIHKTGDKLNLHLDYKTHPKLLMRRKLNIIYYLTPDWDPAWGGGLQLWTHDEELNKPKQLATTIENKFNRLVIFDVSGNSWHGFPEEIKCPDNVYRKSAAVYYLKGDGTPDDRMRAKFVPSKEQESDPYIVDLAANRSK